MTFNWVENALTIDLKLNIIRKYTVHTSFGPNSKIWPNTEYQIYSVFEKWSNTNTE